MPWKSASVYSGNITLYASYFFVLLDEWDPYLAAFYFFDKVVTCP